MNFEWDETKCAENIRVRGLDFQDAIPAFFDVERKIWEDDRRDYGEVRYNMLAESNNRIFAVTFTIRAGVVRIISFRKANDRETRKYGQL
ncbi:BrnT family toxin [Pleomorphomonas sp. PLEO]|uniref:BrnT family toxin n=1 Tax=Pleomorphomonas sp. PLEO TaxID=3239306 RepID=UPI00351E6C90